MQGQQQERARPARQMLHADVMILNMACSMPSRQ